MQIRKKECRHIVLTFELSLELSLTLVKDSLNLKNKPFVQFWILNKRHVLFSLFEFLGESQVGLLIRFFESNCLRSQDCDTRLNIL